MEGGTPSSSDHVKTEHLVMSDFNYNLTVWKKSLPHQQASFEALKYSELYWYGRGTYTTKISNMPVDHEQLCTCTINWHDCDDVVKLRDIVAPLTSFEMLAWIFIDKHHLLKKNVNI